MNKHLIPRTVAAGLALVAVTAVIPGRADASPPRHQRAAESIRRLGSNLEREAAARGMRPEQLEQILENDQSAQVDEAGSLLYVDQFPEAGTAPQPALSGTSAASWSSTPAFPTADTFKLESQPEATRVIYLDFNGHTVTNTKWNNAMSGDNPRPKQKTITLGAFDLDDKPGSFSAREHAAIQNAFLSVREDFSFMKVRITTKDPGLDAIQRTNSADKNYGVRVVITNDAWYSCGCSGSAYGSFGNENYWKTDTPAWVLWRGSDQALANTISHEVGHTLGLSHDGLSANAPGCNVTDPPSSCEYYRGHGDWTPIMGDNLTTRRLTTWDKGEYTNSNRTSQDDIKTMRDYGGLEIVHDGQGSSPATAYGVSLGWIYRGEPINSATDVDTWKFQVPTSKKVTVKVVNWYGDRVDTNLNVRLRLLDSSGKVITTASPADRTDASISQTLKAGTYFAQVDGVSDGTPTTGLSDYGSIGRYNISFT